MPFARPTLPTLVERTSADTESKLIGADARLRRSNLNVFARVLSGAVHGLYGFLTLLAKQVMPDQAEEEFLERHASMWLANGRVPASYAFGPITVTGTDGYTLPAGTLFKRADGVAYLTDSDATIVAGTATVTVVAEVSGQIGNAVAGTTLNIDSPVAGINAAGTVSAARLTGGAEQEEDDSLRARVLDRIRQTPHGGARNDYVAWTKEVPGVTRAWCYPLEMGDGTVTVRFCRDNDASLIPDPAEVAVVQAYIEPLAPVEAHLFVVAPVADPITFNIQLVPATAATKAAVEASLRDLLIREAEPEGGAGEGVVLLSHIREAISLAAGETDSTLLAPVANVLPAVGHMATFGNIVWS